MIDGPRLAPVSGGPARQLVVFLHGYGSDGNDLIDIGRAWSPLLPQAAFVSPHAPQPSEMSAFGFQWFSLQANDDRRFFEDAKLAADELNAFLDQEMARLALPDAAVALVGFSQGTMTALHTAPRRARPIGGIVGYSGRIILPGRLKAETVSRPPVLLVHGTLDPILPIAALGEAETALADAGFEVTAIERPELPHSIDPEGVEAGGAFLQRIFATPAA